MLTTTWPSRTANSVCGQLFCYSCEPFRCGPAKLTVLVSCDLLPPLSCLREFLAVWYTEMQGVQMHVKMSNCIVPVAWQVIFASDSTHLLDDRMLLENLISWLDVYLFLSGKGETFFFLEGWCTCSHKTGKGLSLQTLRISVWGCVICSDSLGFALLDYWVFCSAVGSSKYCHLFLRLNSFNAMQSSYCLAV